MSGACGGQFVTDAGVTVTCSVKADTGWPLSAAHRGRDHSALLDDEIVTWPCCSPYCLKDHAHGRYRLHVGQPTGPGSLSGRAPKLDKPSRRKAKQCKACLHEAELAADGLCADRQACASRIAPLFPEIPL